jgi:hypothetical protein
MVAHCQVAAELLPPVVRPGGLERAGPLRTAGACEEGFRIEARVFENELAQASGRATTMSSVHMFRSAMVRRTTRR